MLSSAGTSIVFSTYLWGQVYAVAVDSSGNIYASGYGNPIAILNAYNGIFNYQRCSPPPQQQCETAVPEPQPFALKIAPTAGPVLAVPTAVQFIELVPVGGTSDGNYEAVLLANASSSGTVNISNIAIAGDFTQTNNCPSALTAATSCVVQVTFAPTAVGLRTGTLTITDDQPGSPQVVKLSGTAVGPQVGLSPSTLTFGPQPVGTTSPAKVVTLTNTGGVALSIAGISTSGDFGESNNCGLTVQPNGACQISVTFTPTALGTRSGTLSITDNAPGSPQMVPLSGAGGVPDFGIGPASGSPTSQTISAGQSAAFSLVVTPSGPFSGTVNLSCGITPAVTPAPTCSLPSSVNVTAGTAAPVKVMVSTTAPVAAGTVSYHDDRLPRGWGLAWTLVMFGAGLAGMLSRRRLPAMAAPMIALAVASWVGCGGGGGSSSHTTPGTPAGTYTATITATSGSLNHDMTLTVIVQ